MTGRARRAVIFLPVAVTLLIAAAIGGLVIVQDQRQTGQIAEAEEVAQAYLRDVSAFRSAVVREVGGARTADPGDLRRVLLKAIAEPPRLSGAPTYGVDNSQSYAEARATRRTLLEPYEKLGQELRRADVALDFIAAARTALKLRVSDYVGSSTISTSAPLRNDVIPAFTRARDELAAVRVPKGQDELAATVRGAMQYVIDQATALAVNIEAGRAYSFSYTEQFQTAIDAVEDYATTVKGDVTEAVDAVTSTP